MSLQEYKVDVKNVAEWLPWGGLLLPHVMKNKDGSFVSIIQYEPFSIETETFEWPDFPRGWVLNTERQHHMGYDFEEKDENGEKKLVHEEGKLCDYIVICWNPFVLNSGKVRNTLGDAIEEKECLEYFGEEVKKLADKAAEVTKVRLLEYQEILNFLTFTLTFDYHKVEMPEIPLYLDVLLSQDADLHFKTNSIAMGDMSFFVCSILGRPNLNPVFKAFTHTPYRYVKRLLCFNEKQAMKDIRRYSATWCSGRKYVTKAILNGLCEGKLHGYYSEYFIFLLDEQNRDKFIKYMEDLFGSQELKLSYRKEDFYSKDIWWGSIPGIFRADVNAPIQYLTDIGEMMQRTGEIKKKKKLDDSINQMERISLGKGL